MQPPMQLDSQVSARVQPDGAVVALKTARWGPLRRTAFLFAVVYFSLFTLYIPFHFLPFPPMTQLFAAHQSFWRLVVLWVSEHLLHVQVVTGIPNLGNGSKDTMWNYVQVLCYAAFAVVVTAIWSWLDRKRPNYARLEEWFRVYLRFVLGITMIQYGVVKVFPLQFPPPSLTTLLEPYGDSSPMHLLWTFMGASTSYTFFAGMTEVLGGVLLLIPWTVTLGALVSLAASGNVLMLNFGYDVPVKIFTLHLIVICILLLIPDMRRLADFFIFNRGTEPPTARALFRQRLLNQAAIAAQLLFALVFLVHGFYSAGQDARTNTEFRAKAPLYGIWSVQEFSLDGQVRPPVLTDTDRWQAIVIENNGVVQVHRISGALESFGLKVDSHERSLHMSKPNDWRWAADFNYENPRPEILTLTGQMDGHLVTVTLHRIDESKFLLTSRGFHWINEFSLNR
jgi:uncharacterized membrane protein YphA (DoxX/SURF4 family)